MTKLAKDKRLATPLTVSAVEGPNGIVFGLRESDVGSGLV
jgi:hypothetical protein